MNRPLTELLSTYRLSNYLSNSACISLSTKFEPAIIHKPMYLGVGRNQLAKHISCNTLIDVRALFNLKGARMEDNDDGG